MFFNAREGKVTVCGKETDYITFGRGKKNLVMIQGLNTNGIKGMALPLAFMYRIFSKNYRVFVFDRRKEVREGITVRDMASDIAEAMDSLGIKKADIIGVSQGGMIAQYLAIERPELVEKLVLAVTVSRNNPVVTDVILKWTELTEKRAYRELVSDMAEKMYSEEYMKRYRPLLPLLTAVQKPKDPERFVILAKSCLTCDSFPELEKISCPVLVIGGRRDAVTGNNTREDFSRIPGAEIFIYENLGHAAYEEAKDFNKRVYSFLSE